MSNLKKFSKLKFGQKEKKLLSTFEIVHHFSDSHHIWPSKKPDHNFKKPDQEQQFKYINI